MVTLFKNQKGAEFAPETFVVVHLAGNKTTRLPNTDIDDAFYQYPDALKIELFKNGTENLSAELLETYYPNSK